MSTMYDRIILSCRENGCTPGFMCDSLGIRRSTISELKNGRSKSLSADRILAFAKFLGVSCDYLMTGQDFRSEFTEQERDLIHAYRIAPLSDQENIRYILRNYMPVPADKAEEKLG